MPQPGANRVDVNTAAKEMSCAGVSNGMGADAFGRQSWHFGGDFPDIALHHRVNAKPGDWPTAPIDEDVFGRSFLADQRLQFPHRVEEPLALSIKEAFDREPNLENLMLDAFFKGVLTNAQTNWRTAVSLAIQAGVAVPAFSASLAYFDSYRQERLPANLLQAQRDYFGAHTYERTDKPGVFHTEWLKI